MRATDDDPGTVRLQVCAAGCAARRQEHIPRSWQATVGTDRDLIKLNWRYSRFFADMQFFEPEPSNPEIQLLNLFLTIP